MVWVNLLCQSFLVSCFLQLLGRWGNFWLFPTNTWPGVVSVMIYFVIWDVDWLCGSVTGSHLQQTVITGQCFSTLKMKVYKILYPILMTPLILRNGRISYVTETLIKHLLYSLPKSNVKIGYVSNMCGQNEKKIGVYPKILFEYCLMNSSYSDIF